MNCIKKDHQTVLFVRIPADPPLLSKAKRLAYEKIKPIFWSYTGPEGDEIQKAWFKELLKMIKQSCVPKKLDFNKIFLINAKETCG